MAHQSEVTPHTATDRAELLSEWIGGLPIGEWQKLLRFPVSQSPVFIVSGSCRL